MKHVLKPIEQPFSPEVAAIFARYPQGKDGYVIQLFRVFANSMRFLTKKGALNLLDNESPLSIHEREIIILRVTANNNCEYEWGVHVTAFAKRAKLTDEQVAATRLAGSANGCWTHPECLLIDCVDQLCENAVIENPTYEQFQNQWNLEQQLEILALCGNYHLISFVANTSRIDPETAMARFV
jgi:hypothetical protein